VAEVQPDLALRATANVQGEVATGAPLSHMVNVNNQGRCAITLDPKDRLPGQQPYQGVVPLFGDRHEKLEKLSEVIEHYMLQSEQLDTRLVLAANDQVAAGLLIQRLPLQGESNLSGAGCDGARRRPDRPQRGLQPHRHSGREPETRGAADAGRRHHPAPPVLGGGPSPLRTAGRFRRTALCLHLLARAGERHARRSLGREEVDSIIAEQGQVEVGCDFCGAHYHFDPVDAAQVFLQVASQPPGSPGVH
jgi:molecular chaperone Hsp33